MPGFDGLRALELVRAVNSEIPFFIVSGVIDEEQAVAAMKAGAQDYFFKGKLARLGPAVGRELHEAEQRRQRREAAGGYSIAIATSCDTTVSDSSTLCRMKCGRRSTSSMSLPACWPVMAERMEVSGRQERISEIQGAVARMTRVIDKVLLTSRLELQRWDLRSETFDPAAWCEEFLASDFGLSGQRHRIRMTVADLPSKVAMDQRVIEIALQNLLSNALKYSPPDSPVDLELCGGCFGQNPSSRCGIAALASRKQTCPTYSTSFYRARNVGDVPGTGLGLAIVKACADVHGGTLEMESKPGIGTCVRDVLPDWLRRPN